MPTVHTVLGPIDSQELGFTLGHEHVAILPLWRHLAFLYDKPATITKATRLLTEAKEGGVDSMIELTPLDLGREVTVYREVSEKSGVHVVVCTGLWRDIPRFFWTQEPDYIARFILHEIEHGIDDTGIIPGVIKVASDSEGVTEHAEKVLRAAAMVCRETGVPISTHQWAPLEVGKRQMEVLLEEKAPPHLVCLGHSADSTDVPYLEGLLEAGCYLSMDRYPGSQGRPDWIARNRTVEALVKRGWAPRIMLGHDYGGRPILEGVEPEAEDEPVRYTFLSRVAIPDLIAHGVSQAQVDVMMREAPRRFLTGETPLPREGT